MFANITIITGGIIYHREWEEADKKPLDKFIKDECYFITEDNDKAVVNVEIKEIQGEREYGSNLPDDYRYASGKTRIIDNLVFLYDDQSESLKLMASHITHKSLTKNKHETR